MPNGFRQGESNSRLNPRKTPRPTGPCHLDSSRVGMVRFAWLSADPRWRRDALRAQRAPRSDNNVASAVSLIELDDLVVVDELETALEDPTAVGRRRSSSTISNPPFLERRARRRRPLARVLTVNRIPVRSRPIVRGLGKSSTEP